MDLLFGLILVFVLTGAVGVLFDVAVISLSCYLSWPFSAKRSMMNFFSFWSRVADEQMRCVTRLLTGRTPRS